MATSCSACGGAGRTVVPDLRGKPGKQALGLLAAQHLCFLPADAEWPRAMKARPGTVVDQDPSPGARVKRDMLVRVWVASGSLHAGANGTGQIEVNIDSVPTC